MSQVDPGVTEFPLAVGDLLKMRARLAPEAVAIASPGRPPLSYRALYAQVDDVVDVLNGLGLGRNSRVAVAMPNGPEAAVAFLAVAAGATIAPVNPDYRAPEYESLFTALGIATLLVVEDAESPAVNAAQALGVPIIRAVVKPDSAAGLFTLSGRTGRRPVRSGWLTEHDVAMTLATSGTTSRPKIVPLTHANICHGARNVGAALALSPAERCLNVMPLFHVHGLIGAVLASIMAGGSVVCVSGYVPTRFADWLEVFEPTWYTAVPTIHQAILARRAADGARLARARLRCIRSCSAPLPPRVAGEVEELFQTPVVQAYGMTEAAHQIASNPLPPHQRKSGSVGLPVGVEVAILGPAGTLVPAGQAGEIVIRGPSVTRGYEGVATGVVDGWLRTGDEGRIDDDGHVVVTGRLKEMINRAGAKIAPAEVDEALLAHPAVAQAVSFAIPHPTLGEDVAAALVLRHGAQADEDEIREFASRRLAEFKVPRRLLVLDRIPQGPTGKLQRIGLAEVLGLVGAPAATASLVAPQTAIEITLAGIWRDVLRLDDVSVDADFFEIGGDSLLGTELFGRVCETFDVQVSLTQLFQRPTIRAQAVAIGASQHAALSPYLVAIQPSGVRPPLFCASAGTYILHLLSLGLCLAPEQPLYALRPGDMTIATMDRYDVGLAAACYVAEICARQPDGPYFILGWCAGCAVALEIGRQLVAQGQRVALMALVTPPLTGHLRQVSKALSQLSLPQNLRRILHTCYRLCIDAGRAVARHVMPRRAPIAEPTTLPELIAAIHNAVNDANRRALVAEQGRRGYPGSVALFLTDDTIADMPSDPRLVWESIVTGRVDIYRVSGDHDSIAREPHVRDLVQQLRHSLAEASTTRSTDEACDIGDDS